MNDGERTVLYLNDITRLHIPIISIIMGYAREVEPLHYVYHGYWDDDGVDKHAFRTKEEAIKFYHGEVAEHILYAQCEYCDKKEIKRLVKLTDNFEKLDNMPLQWLCKCEKGYNYYSISCGSRIRPIFNAITCESELDSELEISSDSEFEK